MRRFLRLCSAFLLLTLVPPSPLLADSSAPDGEQREARLLALIEELATLLDSLPPERREAVRQLIDERLAELPSAREPSSDQSASRIAESPASQPPVAPPTSPPPTPPAATATPPTPPTPPAATATPPTSPAPAPSPATTTPTATAVIRPPSPTTSRTVPPPSRPIETTPTQTTPTQPPPPIEPQPAPATEPVSPPPTPRLRCELAVPLDTDQDRRLTAFDRYWRHLYLWTDVDGDGDLDEREAESPYERGIRSVELGLGSFVRGKGKRKRTLDITIEERVIFDVGGDGYGGPVPRRDDGALVVDASAVREDGGPDLRDQDGQPLVGLQAIRPGQRWVLPDGSTLVPRCR